MVFDPSANRKSLGLTKGPLVCYSTQFVSVIFKSTLYSEKMCILSFFFLKSDGFCIVRLRLFMDCKAGFRYNLFNLKKECDVTVILY